jgi:glycogen debranching enzyme
MAKARKTRSGDQPSIQIPSSGFEKEQSRNGEPITPVTPKTPADEGIDFFEAEITEGEAPIRVYELGLDPNGGPSKRLTVCHYIIQIIFPILSTI